jgi:ribosomal protein S6 kinase alpha-5
MELLKGGRLTDLIKKRFKKGKFSDLEASAMIKAILSAVSYMHEKGIVHRDLKPGRFLYFFNLLFRQYFGPRSLGSKHLQGG